MYLKMYILKLLTLILLIFINCLLYISHFTLIMIFNSNDCAGSKPIFQLKELNADNLFAPWSISFCLLLTATHLLSFISFFALLSSVSSIINFFVPAPINLSSRFPKGTELTRNIVPSLTVIFQTPYSKSLNYGKMIMVLISQFKSEFHPFSISTD